MRQVPADGKGPEAEASNIPAKLQVAGMDEFDSLLHVRRGGRRTSLMVLLVSAAILFCSNRNAPVDTGFYCTSGVAFGVIADHDRVGWIAPRAANPGHEVFR